MTDIEKHELIWTSGHHCIRIEITFATKYSIVEHLEVLSVEPERAPLPITPTGYRSNFFPIGLVAEHGGPVAAVRKMLDEAAASPEWQEYLSTSRQGSLF